MPQRLTPIVVPVCLAGLVSVLGVETGVGVRQTPPVRLVAPS